jgi:glyoxylase-like metal-dependent hydrolase (beta-lactamase superfamily II)
MKPVAADVQLLPSRPLYAFNAYLMEDVLVDAGTRHAYKRLRKALGEVRPAVHAITHAHADHQGSSKALCDAFEIELWAGEADADATASGDLADRAPSNIITRWQLRHWAGPAHPVARRLREGDAVGGFTVIETPGHSPGHVAFWREADRTLVAGDVLFGQHPVTGRPGLHEPPKIFTLDPAENRRSIRKVAALEPAVVCFGHGRPWRDPAALKRFADALPA